MNRNHPQRPASKVTKTTRQPITKTRATNARANANATALGKSSANNAGKSVAPRPRSSTDNTQPNTASNVAAWKKRPNWDMRGKINDMESLLKMNHSKIGELEKFRKDLEVTVENKESETKAALQRATELKARLQSIERAHIQEVENMNAQQRIHHQELEDQHLIYKRRLTTIEIEVGDDRRKLDLVQKQAEQQTTENDMLRSTISQTSASFLEVEAEMRMIKLKLELSEGTLLERERTIDGLKTELSAAQTVMESLGSKVDEEERTRARLENVIQELELKAK